MINKVVIGEYKLINVLAICQRVKIVWHFELLIWKPMGKILECAVS